MSGLVSVGEAAELLGCSEGTIRRWADAGRLPTVRLGGEPGGHRRIDVEAALEAWRQPSPASEVGLTFSPSPPGSTVETS